MKAKEVFQEVGERLAQHYEDRGFKYRKTTQSVERKHKEYEYGISFHSESGNTKNRVALFVSIYVAYKNTNKEFYGLFSISLWDLGNYYEIGETHTIEQVVVEISKHCDILLIPFIDIFENKIETHKNEWITQGFLGNIPSHLYKYPHLDYTTHRHYWVGTEFSQKHNEFGFEISLPYILEKFGREDAQICLNNYFNSLNEDAQKYFLEAYEIEKRGTNDIWNCDYQNMPDVGLVKFAVEQNFRINN